jgi:type IV secretory pathway VirB2 component (pilin)
MSVLHRAVPWLILCLLVPLMIDPASAQLVGGGGGGGTGIAMHILPWFISNIAAFIIAAGIIIAGAGLIMGHLHLGQAVGVVIGSIIISQWQILAALVPI